MSQFSLAAIALQLIFLAAIPAQVQSGDETQQGQIYYISSSEGSDSANGLSQSTPIASIAHLNTLNLLPGDQVHFRCGDTWNAEPLRITQSGLQNNPITYSTYPADCPNKPRLSGTQPIVGWLLHEPNIYATSLDSILNLDQFPNKTIGGINQLFRNGTRLTSGRWPNLNTSNGGFAMIDAQTSSTGIADSELPPENWVGASIHIRGMRWYLINRTITGGTGDSLNVNSSLDCWDSNCSGWGYWIDQSYAALDQEGEWFFDTATKTVYLYTGHDPNLDQIEGSVVFIDKSNNMGGIILGKHLAQHIEHVNIQNLEISGWYLNGVSTPVNLYKDENGFVVLQNLFIHDVDGAGINLATWVYDAGNNGNGYDGWRGGHNMLLQNNLIQNANRFGINTYAHHSLIQNNIIMDIALLKNLGSAGMGCSMISGGGACTEDGDGIRLKVDQDGQFSSNNMVLQFNHLERIGYNGIDNFGADNLVFQNSIVKACYSKADCGGLRSFGQNDLTTTTARNLSIIQNLIIDPIGNTDGAKSIFSAKFAFGLYIDNFTNNTIVYSNTISGSTTSGLLFQNSTGKVNQNTLFNNSSAGYFATQAQITGGGSHVDQFTNNILFARLSTAFTLGVTELTMISGSNYNQFYHASLSNHISISGSKTLEQWQNYSNQDAHSSEQINSTYSSAELFYNPTQENMFIQLGKSYRDLSANPQSSLLILQPFTSIILIPEKLSDYSFTYMPILSR